MVHRLPLHRLLHIAEVLTDAQSIAHCRHCGDLHADHVYSNGGKHHVVVYTKYAERGTFIGEYMHMCSPLETALSYDFWSAVWALGAAVGRDVFIPRPMSPVHLNWYVLLVAESGITRKSTAVRMARDIVIDNLGIERVIEGRTTPEHLFARLVEQPHTAIAISELVTFLGRETYTIELPALLTDLYDCPAIRTGGTISRGAEVVRNPYLTFISASTPSWLISAVNPNVVEGGFTSRCMFIYDEQPKQRVSWPQEAESDAYARSLLAETVENARRTREIMLMPSAMQRFDRWYKSRDTHTDLAFLSSFYAREDAHVLRMAACLCINDGTLAIDRKHIDAAVKLITAAKAGALQIFSTRGSTVKRAQGVEKAIKLLRDAGPSGIGHTKLYASVRYYMHADDYKVMLDAMAELGMVQKAVEPKTIGRGGPRGYRYFRTTKITERERMQALVELMSMD